MKYTTDEAMREIMKRSDKIEKKREQRKTNILTGMSVSLIAVLTIVIGLVPGQAVKVPEGTTYGSFLLSPEAGGYVLVALLAFAVGICITVFCLRSKNKSVSNLGGTGDENQAEENENHSSNHGDRHDAELPVGVLVPEGDEGSVKPGNDDRRRDGK